MTFRDMVSSKAVTLCFLLLGLTAFWALCAACRVPLAIIYAVSGAYLFIIAMWLIASYITARRRIDRIRRAIDALDRKYLAGEVLPRPANCVEREYFEIMKTVSRSAIGETEQARRERDDYMEYVEAWIHEIKTPLTACRLILSNGGDARKLRRELKRADNLTESILYYARLGSPEKDSVIAPADVRQAADDAVKSQMDILIASGIRVDVTGGFTAHTDKKQLEFILRQLLINSARYCPGCHISINMEDGRIIYEDDGAGIPAHEISRVTEKGFTGTNGRRMGGATGMGLYIVSGLCAHLGISLEIASRVGEFTRFTFSFDSLTKP